VRPESIEPQPDPHPWTPEPLAALAAYMEAFYDELVARRERERQEREHDADEDDD
jgi:hypothetical protein